MFSFIDLPHKDKNSWEKKKELFKNINPKDISELNNIFFKGKAKFFNKINQDYSKEGEEFMKIFNKLKDLILNIENILPKEIPILEKETTDEVAYTRKQIALIFLLSYFNLINLIEDNEHEMPNFNFNIILSSISDVEFEFGRCFLNYLTIIGNFLLENNKILEEKVYFIRQTKIFNNDFYEKECKLCKINFFEEGSLFDGKATYCVDFANMYIGGGTLEGGCVQEEILFAIEPEATVAMLFMEVMKNNDAIRIDNTIQYSLYSGYARNFKYLNPAFDTKEMSKIKKTKFIAIDASIAFLSDNYTDPIKRDIHKAYVGFDLVNYKYKNKIEKKDEQKNKASNTISTGNWGCGAFRGDRELKFLQQWVAASFAGIERLDYYTFKKMKNVVESFEKLKKKYVNANELYIDLNDEDLNEENILESILNKKDDNNNKKNSKNLKKKKCIII